MPKFTKKKEDEKVEELDTINSSPKDEALEPVALGLSEEDEKRLIKQVQAEYDLAYDFLKAWLDKKKKQLKVYNNQKKDPKSVGDNLLFILMDTLLSSLYDDRIDVIFKGREPGDKQVEENLNLLAEYDYEEMNKPEMDYDTRWDALFYGHAVIDMSGFSLTRKIPTPHLLDPGLFLFDGRASSIDGDIEGRGAMRFCGNTIFVTKRELDESKVYRNVDELKGNTNNSKSEMQSLHEARSDAAGATASNQDKEQDLGDNSLFELLEWRTWFNGKRVLVTLGDDRTRLVRYDDGLLKDGWQISSTHAWRKPHTFLGTSVTDLAEDKQRAIAIIMNLLLRGLKSSVEPDTLYNPDLIANKAELMRPGGRKFIATKNGQGALSNAAAPLNQAQPNIQLITYMIDSLNASAEKSTATPQIQQGAIDKDARTLGELNLLDQKVETRYSLLLKNMMRGDVSFWQEWYKRYKRYFPAGIVEKILRLDTLTNNKFRKLTRENIIAKTDPDVKVVSKALSEAAQMRQLGKWVQIFNLVAADPEADKRYAFRMVAENSGLTKQQIDSALPPTIDEMIAKRENEMLDENKVVDVRKEDNHAQHLSVHTAANGTRAAFAHIETHKKVMLLKKTNPELFPEDQAAQQQQGQPGQEPQEPMQPGGMGQGSKSKPQAPGQMQQQNKMMTTPPSMSK